MKLRFNIEHTFGLSVHLYFVSHLKDICNTANLCADIVQSTGIAMGDVITALRSVGLVSSESVSIR